MLIKLKLGGGLEQYSINKGRRDFEFELKDGINLKEAMIELVNKSMDNQNGTLKPDGTIKPGIILLLNLVDLQCLELKEMTILNEGDEIMLVTTLHGG